MLLANALPLKTNKRAAAIVNGPRYLLHEMNLARRGILSYRFGGTP
ncbi:hypothetical protein [Pantoea ananatis]